MNGFIQLIDKKSKTILGQRKGKASDLENHKCNTWRVSGPLDVIFSVSSDVAQPYKFFQPVSNVEQIFIFRSINDGVMPERLPDWTGTALQLDESADFMHRVTGIEWEAYTRDGEWIGTSES